MSRIRATPRHRRIAGTIVAPREIAIVLFDGVTLLDVAGPAEVFAVASQHAPSPAYRVRTYAIDPAPVRTESGLVLVPERRLPSRLAVDTLLVPGGAGLRRPEVLDRVASVLRRSRAGTRRIASVCTGAYALAAAGLLDGRVATTHWAFAPDLAHRFPQVRVDADALHLERDGIATSAGVTAGIDLCLALVEADLGHAVAMATARELVVYVRRAGSQAQFSGPLRLQAQAGSHDRLSALQAWLLQHPSSVCDLAALAARAQVSPRQLQRLVRARLGLSVTQWVERVRIDEARRLLAEPRAALPRIAAACGYGSADALSRAFLRHTGVRPLEWRQRFGGAARR